MEISINALILAIKAMQRDIEQHRARLGDVELSDDDADYHAQYVMDLTKALGEIGDVYEHSRAATPAAPALDLLLRGGAVQSELGDGSAADGPAPPLHLHRTIRLS